MSVAGKSFELVEQYSYAYAHDRSYSENDCSWFTKGTVVVVCVFVSVVPMTVYLFRDH